MDDALGNFSLTLVDTLDTLVVLGDFDEFERAARLVVEQIRFDSNLVVSVFETNIRMVGGLISAHLMSVLLKQREEKPPRMSWYSNQLLKMASNLADRLLPAFNSTSGVPYSRVNLKRGLLPHLKRQQDTCTACGGTMILEWAALSRLTGNPIYEEKARKAMDFLWNQRHRGSDLMGTVLNVNSGDWVRRDSGIGAGIDSYYEYTLKAYILLGEEDYLYRFNKHYEAVMRYLNKGPVFIDVHMHKPQIASRSFMDALLAFWPGLQVLKGDLRGAIEMHQMLYNVVKRHKFLPDAFTHDLQVHWAQHPLRPEFIESTYFLYRATKDPHYLEVAKEVMDSLELNVRVPCGFASVKDVRTMEHDDQMESFVLAETFKYLFMIFSEPGELPFHPDNYVLTTEAHFLPLSIAEMPSNVAEDRLPRRMLIDPEEIIEQHEMVGTGTAPNRERPQFASACPNPPEEGEAEEGEEHFPRGIPLLQRTPDKLASYGSHLREGVNRVLGTIDQFMANAKMAAESGTCPAGAHLSGYEDPNQLHAWAFNPADPDHLEQLARMGIHVEMQPDGRVQLTHTPNEAEGVKLALRGLHFIREMTKFANDQAKMPAGIPLTAAAMDRIVQAISSPHFGLLQFMAAPAQFGMEFSQGNSQVVGEVALADPLKACNSLQNAHQLLGRIVVALRGSCMFEDKARLAQRAGAVGLIVIDNQPGTSADLATPFAMSAAYHGERNEQNKVQIPAVFLFHAEGQLLMDLIFANPKMIIRLGQHALSPVLCLEQFLRRNPTFQQKQFPIANQFLAIDAERVSLRLNFLFGQVDADSPAEQKQAAVERNMDWLSRGVHFGDAKMQFAFIGHCRVLAYSLLGFPSQMSENDFREFRALIGHLRLRQENAENREGQEQNNLPWPSIPSKSSERKLLGSRSLICKLREPASQSKCSEVRL